MATAAAPSSSSRRRGFAIEAWIFVLLLAVFGLWCWWLVAGARLAYRVAAGATPEASASTAVLEQLGQTGDLFGGLNALFAALAFVGVVWAGSLQRRMLLDARAAYELERQANQLERDAIGRQQFEATFFQMLSLVRDLGRQGAGPMADPPGETSLNHLAAVLFARASTAELHGEAAMVQVLRDMVQTYETDVFGPHSSVLGAYFRALYQLLGLIDRQPDRLLDRDSKVHYANIVRGQIPESLLLMLAVSSLTPRGESFCPLIGRYGLLKHLQPHHRDTLKPAFGQVLGEQAFLGRLGREQITCASPDPVVAQRILTLVREEIST